MSETIQLEVEIEDAYVPMYNLLKQQEEQDGVSVEEELAEALGPQVEQIVHQSYQAHRRSEE